MLSQGKLSKARDENDKTNPSAFTVPNTDHVTYALQQSIILDSGATVHVCNDRTRFFDYRLAEDDDVLYAGDSIIPITGLGKINCTVTCSDNTKRKITLHEVVYIPSFHCSVASLRKFLKANVHWDTANARLTYEGKTFAYTPIHHGQWCLEYHPVEPPIALQATTTENESQAVFRAHSSRKPKPINSGSADEWHNRMGHLYEEALKQLPHQTTGMSLTTQHLSQNICEQCSLTNSKRKLSRRSPEPSPAPYHTVDFDLIQMTIGNGDAIYVMHFYCRHSHMNHVYILTNKKENTLLLTAQAFCAYVKTRWDLKVRIFHRDNEPSCGNRWDA